MRAIGRDGKLWRAEVVLRVPLADAERNQQQLVEAVASASETIEVEDVPRMPDVTTTSSYDMQPPLPDGGVGVAAWVLAATVGEAAEIAWAVVDAATRTFTTEASLWDLRIIPRDAILSAPVTGNPLTK
jgi:hypothetical protein